MKTIKHVLFPVITAAAVLLSGCNLPQNQSPTFVPPLGMTATPVLVSYHSPTSTTKSENPPPLTPSPETETQPTETPMPSPTLPPTATPPPTATSPPTPSVERSPILYQAQAGDTLDVVATRFGVKKAAIESTEPLPQQSFINPGQLLIIPQTFINTTRDEHLLPDSEFV